MRSYSFNELHFSGFPSRPKTAIMTSQPNHSSASLFSRSLVGDDDCRTEFVEEAASADDEAEDNNAAGGLRRRTKSTSGKAGLNEWTSGVKTMVRRASISMRSALHPGSRRAARKNSNCVGCRAVSYEIPETESEEEVLYVESTVASGFASPAAETFAHNVSPRLVRRMFSFHRDRRNAISGPGTSDIQARSHSFGAPIPGNGLEPPIFPDDLSQGAAARAAAAAAAQTERLHFSRFRMGKHDAMRSVISLPKDSESGVFVDSQDESDMDSAILVLRKGRPTCGNAVPDSSDACS